MEPGIFRVNRVIIGIVKNKYIVAVSGGVDSVVLLDMLAKKGDAELVVAHFDHGMRADSYLDSEFVRQLAAKYNLPFETKREELGSKAGEDKARRHRYKFLQSVVNKYGGVIATAHHLDDVVETIAINIVRSTGWRGLAVLDSTDIYRPLLNMTKQNILDYAEQNKLQWRDDPTNISDRYLRNKLRIKLAALPKDEFDAIIKLWQSQLELKKEIDSEIASLVRPDDEHYSRHFFTMVKEPVAIECLRAVTQGKLTRPQMRNSLIAIKTAKPGAKFHSGAKVELDFTTRFFKVKMLK